MRSSPPRSTTSAPTLSENEAQWLTQAVQAHRSGQWSEAAAGYAKLLQNNPHHFDALHLSGVLLTQQKQYEQAIFHLKSALLLKSNIPALHSNLAIALAASGDADQALAHHHQAVLLAPNSAEFLFNRGVFYQDQQDFLQAQHDYEATLRLQPNHLQTLNNLGIVLRELGQLDAAHQAYARAIEIDPQYAPAHFNRGLAWQAEHQWQHAIDCYQQVLLIEPHHPQALNNLGNAYKALEQLDQAQAAFQQAIAQSPRYAEAHYNLGNLYKEMDQTALAITSYDQAIECQSDYALAYNNRGIVFHELGMFDKALADYQTAASLKSAYAEALWNQSLIALLQGDYQTGWPLYEWRWKQPDFSTPTRHYEQPTWQGEVRPHQTLFVYAEQGLGDTLQFIRFARQARTRVGRLIAQVQPSLMPLLKHALPQLEFIDEHQTPDHFDVQIALLSLPLALNIFHPEQLDAHAYLSAPPHLSAAWAKRVAALKKPLIGLCWRGNPQHRNDHHRSLSLKQFVDVLPPQFTYVSLQRDPSDQEQAWMQQATIWDASPWLENFAETAALCQQLDTLICVDTSVAHLAGALGRPTRLLLPLVNDWRWLRDRADSPWYDGMTLYRQTKRRNWQQPLQQLVDDLKHLLK